MPLPSKLPDDFGKKTASTNLNLVGNRYLIKDKIGSGNFGTAFLVKDQHEKNEKQIMKVLKQIAVGPLDPGETVDAMQEAKLLGQMRHKNIVQFHKSFLDGHFFCIVIEYCEGGDLECKLREQKKLQEVLPEAQVIKWTKQLLKALEYMHRKRILHRDLKSRNIFLKDNQIKVGDFGISRILMGSSDKASTFVGTPYYMSPEVLKHEQYDEKCDIWSLGCVLYEICCLQHAFEGVTLMSVMMKIVSDHTPSLPDVYSRALNTVMERMLDREPENRQTAWQILTHPLFKKTNGPHMTARDRLRIRKQKEADANMEHLNEIAKLQLKENARFRRESKERNFTTSAFNKNMQVNEVDALRPASASNFSSSRFSSSLSSSLVGAEEELHGTVVFQPLSSDPALSLHGGEETLKPATVIRVPDPPVRVPSNHEEEEEDLDSTGEMIRSLIRDGVIPEDADVADTFYTETEKFESVSSDEDQSSDEDRIRSSSLEEDIDEDDLLPDENFDLSQSEYRDLLGLMEGVLDLDDSTVARGTSRKNQTIATLRGSTVVERQKTARRISEERLPGNMAQKNPGSDKSEKTKSFTNFNMSVMDQKIEKLRERCRDGIDDQLFERVYSTMKALYSGENISTEQNRRISEAAKKLLPNSTKCMNFEELVYMEHQRDSNVA